MEVREITAAEEKQRIARLILESLPDWFGIPEAREEYIEKSVKQPFFAAFDGENAVGFLSLAETGRDTAELYVMGVLKEYHRRGEELKKFVAAAHPLGVTVVEDRYDPQEFYSAVTGLENEPERGSRCTVCYRLRMRRAAQYASENGFDWFTTTLSISPHKDAKRINAIGQELEAEFGVKHLPSDFKKHNGYLRSLQLSEEYGLYRQDYCGCEFSAKARGIEK